MNTRPLYIFDLDGTLALIEHRRHFVQRPANWKCWACDSTTTKEGGTLCAHCDAPLSKFKPDWDAFHAACVDDLPNKPVIATFTMLHEDALADVWIFSGRMDTVHWETGAWLKEHRLTPDRLLMRAAGDYTPDDVLKRSWYDAMSAEDKARLVAVFDDRDRVVAMWRSLGVTCFQVAPGDF